MVKKDNNTIDKTNKAKKSKKELELAQKLDEITHDLQRTRADFENYMKRSEVEKAFARESGQSSAILKLLPVIDNIERAITYTPEELKDNSWVQGVTSLVKNLEKSLKDLNLKRIDARPGTIFNPDLHEAILFDEDSEGEHEVITEEMQPGYMLNDRPIRHSMVKVTRK